LKHTFRAGKTATKACKAHSSAIELCNGKGKEGDKQMD
jgi:hypothetical protein